MDYVLEPKKLCAQFTLKEALLWVAFRTPATERNITYADLHYFDLYREEANIFITPRTQMPSFFPVEVDKFSIPPYPKLSDTRPYLSARTFVDHDDGHIKVEPEDAQIINKYIEQTRDARDAYKKQAQEYELIYASLLDKADESLMEAIRNMEIQAQGRVKATLKTGIYALLSFLPSL